MLMAWVTDQEEKKNQTKSAYITESNSTTLTIVKPDNACF